MPNPTRIKCKFCDWTTPRFRRSRSNRKITGPDQAYGRLLDHIERKHPTEWPGIESFLDEVSETELERESASSFS